MLTRLNILLPLTLLFPLLAAGEIKPEPAVIFPKAVDALLLEATRLPGAIVAVGERGHILRSEDQAKSWKQIESPSRSMLNCVAESGGMLWAAGHDATIIHSNDGGQSWSLQYFDAELEMPIFDLWFRDDKEGVAIGAYGLYLYTKDGGITWKRKSVDDEEPHFFQMAKANDGPLYMVGEFGSIYRSVDLGDSWEKLESPYEGSLFGLLPLDPNRLLVFGLRGNVFLSNDQGASWEPLESGTKASLLSGALLSDNRLALVGLIGTVLTSPVDSPRLAPQAIGNRKAIASVLPDQPNQILLFGEGGAERFTLANKEGE